MTEIKVTRTVRVHESTKRRFLRLTGDGTPENTRITDMHGNPIPETVISLEIAIGAGNCAKGVFKYVALGENGETIPVYDPRDPDADPDLMIREFEAWVVFEPPPRAPSPGYVELAVELEEAREKIAELNERIAAASFALGDGGACGASACDTRVPGPGAGELLEIIEPPAAPIPIIEKSELLKADPEGPPDPMARRAPPPVPDWAVQDRTEGSRLRDRDADDG